MAQTSRDFGSMLDELLEAEEAARGPAGHVSAVDFLAAMDELQARGTVIGEDVAARYGEAGSDLFIASPAAPERRPVVQPSANPADIRRELGLDAARDPAALDAARRKFAFTNHPDRVRPELRERAELRMRIANVLVDEAKRNSVRS